MLNEEALRVLESLDGWVAQLSAFFPLIELIDEDHSCTLKRISPFSHILKDQIVTAGSHWGRSSLKQRSNGRVWQARKEALFPNHLDLLCRPPGEQIDG